MTIDIKEEDIIRTPSLIKSTWKFSCARFMSNDGLPSDYINLRQFIIACLGDEKFRNILDIELTKLEASNLGYSKELIYKSIHFFNKEYYKNAFVKAQIKDLSLFYYEYEKNKEDNARIDRHAIKEQLVNILLDLNLNLAVINDCLLLVTMIFITKCDLINEEVMQEDILAPEKMKFGEVKYKRSE